jgi:hypothetical protein
VEYWYWHRTSIENAFGHSKHGAALRNLPSGYCEVNTAWTWGALLAVTMAGWLHQLTATEGPHGRLSGWGVRVGKAMIETFRHRLIRVPARLASHAGQAILRLPPDRHLLAEVLAPAARATRSALTCPACRPRPSNLGTREPGASSGLVACACLDHHRSKINRAG